MKTPSNHTEREVTEMIIKISKRLSPRYVFPGYELEDIEQQAFLLGMEALETYDENYKLHSYLFTFINNRLKTLKRNEYFRVEEGTAKDIQQEKKRIKSPEAFSEEFVFTEDVTAEIQYNDLVALIDRELPADFRTDFLRMTNGEKIPQTRKEKLEEVIREILVEYEYDV